MFPEEPGVNPRSNSERPSRQIWSRRWLSAMKGSCFSAIFPCYGSSSNGFFWQRGQAVLPRGKIAREARKPAMSESQQPRVAVIGLGSMGYGMATSLRRAGFDVTGCDVSADSVKRFVADGGRGAATPGEAARHATVVVSVVVN